MNKQILKNYTVNDNIILITTNGTFIIVPIEVCGKDEVDDLFTFGGMYISDEGDYPLEIQYIDNDIDMLINKISKDGDILEVINNTKQQISFK